jgi:Beige/BEACH domain/PH domain associated with Beige/BEACH
MSSSIDSIISELDHADVLLSSALSRCISIDLQQEPVGPSYFFSFEHAEGDAHPIEIPTIPERPSAIGSNKGWAFALWFQLSSKSMSMRSTNAMLLARFTAQGSISEIEVWLIPTDSPAKYKLTIKTITTQSASGFRGASKKAASIEFSTSLLSSKWHHLCISQSQPSFLNVIKNSKITVFIDGRMIGEQDSPCPNLPFSAIVLGANFDGFMAHPQLYSERLPLYHAVALFNRGPNVPTLFHALSMPSFSGISPELQRAGFITSSSLDLLHEGMPLTGGLNSTNRGASTLGKDTYVPSLLMHLDARSCKFIGHGNAEQAAAFSLPTRETAVDGLVVDLDMNATDKGYQISVQNVPLPPSTIAAVSQAPAASRFSLVSPSFASKPPVASLPSSVSYVECPVWWSKGDGLGVPTFGRKAYQAIIAEELVANEVPACEGNFVKNNAGAAPSSASSRTINAGVLTFVAKIGPGVRIVSAVKESKEKSIPSPDAHIFAINSASWHSVGGVMRILELVRTLPFSHPILQSRVREGVESGVSHSSSYDHNSAMHLVKSYLASHNDVVESGIAHMLGVAGSQKPSDNSRQSILTDPVASLLHAASNLLQVDYNFREQMFQLRGFIVLMHVLSERISKQSHFLSEMSFTGIGLTALDSAKYIIDSTRKELGLPQSSRRSSAVGTNFSTPPSPVADACVLQLITRLQQHPISLDVWMSIKDLLERARSWGNEWSPLFVRAIRFLACHRVNYRVIWAAPIDMAFPSVNEEFGPSPYHQPSPSDTNVSGTPITSAYVAPSPLAAPSEHLSHFVRSYGSVLPVDQKVIKEWSKYIHDVSLSMPNILRHPMVGGVPAIVDSFVQVVRSLVVSMVHAQAREQLATSPWLLSMTKQGACLPAPYDRMAKSLLIPPPSESTVSLITKVLDDIYLCWIRLIRVLICYDIGIAVPLPPSLGSSPSAVELIPGIISSAPQYDQRKTESNIAILIQLITILVQEHKQLHVQQESLLLFLKDRYDAYRASLSSSQQAQPFKFVTVGVSGGDPFARAASASIDMFNILMRSFSDKLHLPFEQARGITAALSWSEADHEGTRISSISFISCIISLRRNIELSEYEDVNFSADRKADPASLPSKNSAAGVKESRQRLMNVFKILWNSLSDRANTTSASAIASLQLVLAPDITGYGLAGTSLPTHESTPRPTAKTTGSSLEVLSGVLSLPSKMTSFMADSFSLNKTESASNITHVNDALPINSYDDPDCPPVGSREFAIRFVAASVTSAGAAMTCPEALPIVLMILQQSGLNLQRRVAIVYQGSPPSLPTLPGPIAPSSPAHFRRASTLLLESVDVDSKNFEEFLAVEVEARVKTVLDLSLLIKAHPQNVSNWMKQTGWQGWLLDLIYLPHAPRIEEVIKSITIGSESSLFSTEIPVNVVKTDASSLEANSASSKNQQFEKSNVTIGAIAEDVLISLLMHALEFDKGWRVWQTTLAWVHERYKQDPKTMQASLKSNLLGSSLEQDISCGIGTLIASVLNRVCRERPKLTVHLRTNMFRSLGLAAARIPLPVLSSLTSSAVEFVQNIRATNKTQTAIAAAMLQAARDKQKAAEAKIQSSYGIQRVLGNASQEQSASPSASLPPVIAPEDMVTSLSSEEVVIILRVLIPSIPSICGLDIYGNYLQTRIRDNASPFMGIIRKPEPIVLSLILALIQELHDDEIISLFTHEVSDASNFTSQDILLYILSGLQIGLESAYSISSIADNQRTSSDSTSEFIDAVISSSDDAIVEQNMLAASILGFVNNSKCWGSLKQKLAPFTDEAYIHGRGREIPIGGVLSKSTPGEGTIGATTKTAVSTPGEFSDGMMDVGLSTPGAVGDREISKSFDDDTLSIPPPSVDRARAVLVFLNSFINDATMKIEGTILASKQKVKENLSSNGKITSDNLLGKATTSWIEELLISEYRQAPLHPVASVVDETALRVLRRNAVVVEATRMYKISQDILSKAKSSQAHWIAIRIGLSLPQRVVNRQLQALQLSKKNMGKSSSDTNFSDDSHRPSFVPFDYEKVALSVKVPIKIDSHELPTRARSRLARVKTDKIVAPTYVQYGKMSNSSLPTGKNVQESAKEVAAKLAQAGAIKNLNVAASTIVVDGDEDDEKQLRSRAALDVANEPSRSRGESLVSEVTEDGTETASSVESFDDTEHPSSGASSLTAIKRRTKKQEPEDLDEAVKDASSIVAMSALEITKGVIAARASLVKVGGYAPGTIHLMADGSVMWQPRNPLDPPDPENEWAHSPDPEAVAPPKRIVRFSVNHITAIFLRAFRLSDSAIEIFVAPYGGSRRRRYFFAFENGSNRRDEVTKKIIEALPRSVAESLALKLNVDAKYGGIHVLDISHNPHLIYGSISGNAVGFAYVQVPKLLPQGSNSGADLAFAYNYEAKFERIAKDLAHAWRMRLLSNFDYLMALNTFAGRSFNDLTQYPVFPWIISDYSSDRLDLTSPLSFRDLGRPMGALTSARLEEFKSRLESFGDDESIPRFLYGSHYSTAIGTVVHYLLRLWPYTAIHVSYQEGHFDVADRLFSSVKDAWSLNTTSLSEVKELTPEWYSNPHFLSNPSNYNFGQLQDGKSIGNVDLPPWANQSPSQFISIMRQSLESPMVSTMLHKWIDLIFGCKQRGPAALESDNLFVNMTYAGGVDIDAIQDPALRRATQSQITHYGQTPMQLIRDSPHPPRGPYPTKSPLAHFPSPSSAVLSALAFGTLMGDSSSSASSQQVEISKPVSEVKGTTSSATAVSKFVASAAAGVRAVAAVSVLRNNAQKHQHSIHPSASLRPLIDDLKSYSKLFRLFDQPTTNDSSRLVSILSSSGCLPFINRSFTHICTSSVVGGSFWRPDSSSCIPLGLYDMFGSHTAESLARSTVQTEKNSQPSVALTFGDVLSLGSAPPPGVVSLRLPLSAISSLIKLNPAKDASEKCFSIPIGYQLICEIAGVGNHFDRAIDINDVSGISEPPESSESEENSFHVWWPISPPGYKSLGAVITRSTLHRIVKPVSSEINSQSPPDESQDTNRVTYIFESRPTVPQVASCICIHETLLQQASLGEVFPLPKLKLSITDSAPSDFMTPVAHPLSQNESISEYPRMALYTTSNLFGSFVPPLSLNSTSVSLPEFCPKEYFNAWVSSKANAFSFTAQAWNSLRTALSNASSHEDDELFDEVKPQTDLSESVLLDKSSWSNQHWTADSVNIPFRSHRAIYSLQSHGSHISHDHDERSKIVGIRVIVSHANSASEANSSSIIGPSSISHFIITIDATGVIERFHVSAVPSHDPAAVIAYTKTLSSKLSALIGLPNAAPVQDSAGKVSIEEITASYPHSRIKLSADPSMIHASAASSIALKGVRRPVNGMDMNGEIMTVEPPLHLHPVSFVGSLSGDCTAAVYGCGLGQGFELSVLSATHLPSSADSVKTSSAASSTTTASNQAVAAKLNDVSINGIVRSALAIPGSLPEATVTAVTSDPQSGMVAVGFSDGHVGIWRASGLDPLSSRLSLPSMKCRPDLSFCPNPGVIDHIIISPELDLILVAYESYAWLYDLTRCRPIQRIDYELADSETSPSARLMPHSAHTSRFIGGVFTSNGNLIMAVTQKRVDRNSGSTIVSLYNCLAACEDIPIPTITRKFDSIGSVVASCPGRYSCDVCRHCTLAIGHEDGLIRLLDASTLDLLVTFEAPTREGSSKKLPITSIDFSPNLGFIACACGDEFSSKVAVFGLNNFIAWIPPISNESVALAWGGIVAPESQSSMNRVSKPAPSSSFFGLNKIFSSGR